VDPLHVPQSEKKTAREGAALIFEDEASWRQDSTLHSTWARRGSQPEVPVTGQRKTVKIFGSVELYEARFHYRRADVFNAETYLVFLEETVARRYYPRPVHLIQDNASYHKDRTVWDWFKANRRWIEVHQLPPYSPEFNAAEKIWRYTRKEGTHNRYFSTQDDLVDTLSRIFRRIQRRPGEIMGYMRPFF
jgi:hypothetical protein